MIFHTVDIHAYTSSFRHPMLISGTHLTLDVPPVSTILGLINAAAGKYIRHMSTQIGYYFHYEAKGVDVETIYMAEVNKKGKLLPTTRSNVIMREFLFETSLRIYSPDKGLIDFFRSPVYPILLGRSSDLATVDAKSFQQRKMQEIESGGKISGQVIPYATASLPGKIQALSKYFTDTIPRQMIGKEPYIIVDCHAIVSAPFLTYRDNIDGKEVDIFFHQVTSNQL